MELIYIEALRSIRRSHVGWVSGVWVVSTKTQWWLMHTSFKKYTPTYLRNKCQEETCIDCI